MVIFLQAAVRLVGILRRSWGCAAYMRQGRGQERDVGEPVPGGQPTRTKFVPTTLSKVLRCGKFRGYYVMLIKLKKVPVDLKQWFER